jgi:hypothetical protein
MTTLAFWSCSDDHQKVNVVITAGLESHRGNHYRTRKPAWSLLQDQKANVVIIAGPESFVVTTTWVFWSCSLYHVGFLVMQSLPRWLFGPAVMSMLALSTWLSLQDQKDNVVIIAGPGSQRGHHCRTRKPTWSSLQDQKANVAITAGPESQRGHQGRTRKLPWCSDDYVGFLVM